MFVFLNSLERFHIENLVGRKIFLLMNSLLFIIPESHGKILTESHKVYLNWSSACFVYIHYTNRQQVVGKGAIVWKTREKTVINGSRLVWAMLRVHTLLSC